MNKTEIIGAGTLKKDFDTIGKVAALIVTMDGKGCRAVPSAGGILGIPSGKTSIMHFRYLRQ